MFPIKVKTQNDEGALMALNRLVVKNRIAAGAAIIGAMLFIYLLLIAYDILVNGRLSILLLVFLALIIAGLVFVLLMPKRIAKSVKKQIEKQGVSECSYEFFEDHFTDEYSSRLASGSDTVSYSMIVKVVEDNEYFFLFRNNVLAYVIRKNGMKAEEVHALRGALRSCIPEKKYRLLRK